METVTKKAFNRYVIRWDGPQGQGEDQGTSREEPTVSDEGRAE